VSNIQTTDMSNQDNTNHNKPVIGISIGDLNGIGPEVIIYALSDQRILNMVTPVIYGSTKVLSYYRKLFKLDDFNYSQIKDLSNPYHRKVNVYNCWQEMVEINVGQVTPEGGQYAFKALESATGHLKSGQIDALVTAPINKKNIQSDEFKFPGHTEYITEKLEGKDSLMMMVDEDMRVGVVTGHIPLKSVPFSITQDLLRSKLKIMLQSLKNDFGILKPKVAVLGLNPHAGEEGLFGDEEETIIKPVLAETKKKGNLVFGPFPADGFFGSMQHNKFDGVLAMYHDQGLAPFKIMGFESGVNYTAGLSKVRTSPDHGTGYAIAGKRQANHKSMQAAIYLAADIIRQRKEADVSVDI
jgi:4-hydroxythreonine-4-phosphate dehydrogenase